MKVATVWSVVILGAVSLGCANESATHIDPSSGFDVDDPYSPYTPAFGAVVERGDKGPWVVETVAPGSPAAVVGLMPGDVHR